MVKKSKEANQNLKKEKEKKMKEISVDYHKKIES